MRSIRRRSRPRGCPSWCDRAGISGALVDTFVKDGRGLYGWLSDSELADLIARTHGAGASFAVAGQLTPGPAAPRGGRRRRGALGGLSRRRPGGRARRRAGGGRGRRAPAPAAGGWVSTRADPRAERAGGVRVCAPRRPRRCGARPRAGRRPRLARRREPAAPAARRRSRRAAAGPSDGHRASTPATGLSRTASSAPIAAAASTASESLVTVQDSGTSGRPANAGAASTTASARGATRSVSSSASGSSGASSTPSWSIARSASACATSSARPTCSSTARTASANGPPPGTTSTGRRARQLGRFRAAAAQALESLRPQQPPADLDDQRARAHSRPSTDSATAAATSPPLPASGEASERRAVSGCTGSPQRSAAARARNAPTPTAITPVPAGSRRGDARQARRRSRRSAPPRRRRRSPPGRRRRAARGRRRRRGPAGRGPRASDVPRSSGNVQVHCSGVRLPRSRCASALIANSSEDTGQGSPPIGTCESTAAMLVRSAPV